MQVNQPAIKGEKWTGFEKRGDKGPFEHIIVIMSLFVPAVGKRIGKLIVIEETRVPYRNYTIQAWVCVCDCGVTKTIAAGNLKRRAVRSCGCSQRKHGMYGSATYRMFAGAKHRARRLGIPFNLELSDIVIPETCPALGIPIVSGVKSYCDGSPSMDKIHPELGYVKGNIVIVSWKANRMKSNGTLDDLKRLTQFYSSLEVAV